MSKIFLRSLGNYDGDKVSVETGLVCEDPSLAQQQFKDECDINTILERFNVTGQLPVSPLEPQFGDFSGIKDYQSALNAVLEAEESFAALPARVRERFANDPAAFVDFCLDAANRDEMKALGLIEGAPEGVEKLPTEAGQAEVAQGIT
jgi:phage internal scaffolding protein